MQQGSANLNVMIKAARKAGRSLLKDFGEVENLQTGIKAPRDFTQKAAAKAEEIIREDLSHARVNYGWKSAAGDVDGIDPTRNWIVTPLDGGTNFLHGTPHWAVSIALEHKGEIASAVTYDPLRDELFWAEKGTGAWLDGRTRLRVAGRVALIDSLFATNLPAANEKYLPAAIKDLAKLLPASAGVRQSGVPSLDLCHVAAGRLDGFWQRGMNLWDYATGVLILREAGGFVEPLRSGQTLLEDGHVVGGSSGIFEKFAGTVRADG
ncbi:myo-inositol-1(or 4)-monophosphatase [Jannaschia faecimaris]|uniref:Inositol-1-monophosphatase n=1 Tax=Jannaschia faecimaris TaxID=1244108 RepID=A0A1H3PJ10_9RHOB|nr:inositol monophosphatase family protein [Jannaschia faecimaris]SDZ01051.1 myo-inositol-1(or 4)-monophosphatase [Jannaschia faecimaris]